MDLEAKVKKFSWSLGLQFSVGQSESGANLKKKKNASFKFTKVGPVKLKVRDDSKQKRSFFIDIKPGETKSRGDHYCYLIIISIFPKPFHSSVAGFAPPSSRGPIHKACHLPLCGEWLQLIRLRELNRSAPTPSWTIWGVGMGEEDTKKNLETLVKYMVGHRSGNTMRFMFLPVLIQTLTMGTIVFR